MAPAAATGAAAANSASESERPLGAMRRRDKTTNGTDKEPEKTTRSAVKKFFQPRSTRSGGRSGAGDVATGPADLGEGRGSTGAQEATKPPGEDSEPASDGEESGSHPAPLHSVCSRAGGPAGGAVALGSDTTDDERPLPERANPGPAGGNEEEAGGGSGGVSDEAEASNARGDSRNSAGDAEAEITDHDGDGVRTSARTQTAPTRTYATAHANGDEDGGGRTVAGRRRQPEKTREDYQVQITEAFEEQRGVLECDRCKKAGNIKRDGTAAGRLMFKCRTPKCGRTITQQRMIELLGLELKRRGNTQYMEQATERRVRPGEASGSALRGTNKGRPAEARTERQSSTAGVELARARLEIERLKGEITNLTHDRAARSREARRLEREYERTRQEYDQLRQEFNQLRDQLQQERDQLRQERDQLHQERDQLHQELERGRKETEARKEHGAWDEAMWSQDGPLGATPDMGIELAPSHIPDWTQAEATSPQWDAIPPHGQVEATYAAVAARPAAQPTAAERPITNKMRAAARAIVRRPREKMVLETVYLTKVLKMRLSKLRKNLKEWGVDTRRVVNLSFIGGNILEATVTSTYREEFLELVERMGWQQVVDFDPRSEGTLRRARTQGLSPEQRKTLATKLYVQRIARSLRTTRPGPLQQFLKQMMQRVPNYTEYMPGGAQAGTPVPERAAGSPVERAAGSSAERAAGSSEERETTPAPSPTPIPTLPLPMSTPEATAGSAADAAVDGEDEADLLP